jgi:SAM-dependent methyltransferase
VPDDTARLLSILRQLPSARWILDLGCGDCRASAAYAIAYPEARIVYLDRDLVSLRQARRLLLTAALVQGDITRLPLHPRFDLVVARHPDVDWHPDDWSSALRNAANWLTARGVLLITAYSASEIERISGWLSSELVPLPFDSARLCQPDLVSHDRFVLAYQRTLPVLCDCG